MNGISGQSLAEYALVGALVTVVAIPALMLLGLGVDENLSSSGKRLSGDPMVYFDQQADTGTGGVRIISDPIHTGNEQTSGAAAGQPTMKGTGWQATYDPSTGQIIYSMPASGGGGTNTASVNGLIASNAQMTQQMAFHLRALADRTDANGQPLPAPLANLIRKMADTGHEIALEQEALSPWNQKNFLSPKGHSHITSLDVKDKNFIVLYSALQGYFKDPKYAEITSRVGAYSGAISHLAWESLTHWKNYRTLPRESVGTPPEEVADINGASTVTETNADKLDDIADQVESQGNSGTSGNSGQG